VLIDAIDSYASSIYQIFDFESVIEFVKNIDQIAKEKATQVIEHFMNQNRVEKYVFLSQSWGDSFETD
jgi:hypothetical protein